MRGGAHHFYHNVKHDFRKWTPCKGRGMAPCKGRVHPVQFEIYFKIISTLCDFLNMLKLISNVFQIPQVATPLAWVNFPTIIRLHGGAAVSQTGTTSENHTHVRGRGSKPCFDFIMYFFFCCLAWRLPPFFVRGQLLCASLWLLVDLELAHRLNQLDIA